MPLLVGGLVFVVLGIVLRLVMYCKEHLYDRWFCGSDGTVSSEAQEFSIFCFNLVVVGVVLILIYVIHAVITLCCQ